MSPAISQAEARFERARRVAGVVLAPAAFWLVSRLAPAHLGHSGRMLAAVLVATVVLWITELLPLSVT